MPKWTEREDLILETLWFSQTSHAISAVLKLLGIRRSPCSIRNRAVRLLLDKSEDQVGHLQEYLSSPECTFDPEVITAILAVISDEKESPEELLPVEEEYLPVDKLLPEALPSSEKASQTKRKREFFNEVREVLDEIARTCEDKRASSPAPPTSTEHTESVVLVLSDLHIGKLVLDRFGNPRYNVQIAQSLLEKLGERVNRIGAHIRVSSTIDEAVVVLAGDIVDNEQIYETQAYHLDKTLLDQVKVATESLWLLITLLTRDYPRVRVITCRGNHGRTGGAESSNFDNIIYYNLDLLARTTGLPVTVSNSREEYNTFEVKGHTGLVRHEAPQPDGTPSATAKYGGWYAKHKYDFLISAHYHQVRIGYWHGKPLFRNGSLVGGDDLSERMAVDDNPRQLLFGVSQKRCPTFIYTIEF